MVRVWVSPKGEWEQYVATSEAAHLDLAERIAVERGYFTRPFPNVLEHGERDFQAAMTKWFKEQRAAGIDIDQRVTTTERLLQNGWVRYSNGNIEGTPDAIRKQWELLRWFAESDTIQLGMNAPVYFDIVDERGKPVRAFNTTLSEIMKSTPPVRVFREVSEVQQFRRRPQPQALKVRVRNHLRHPPKSCLCRRFKSVDRVRRKLVRRLK